MSCTKSKHLKCLAQNQKIHHCDATFDMISKPRLSIICSLHVRDAFVTRENIFLIGLMLGIIYCSSGHYTISHFLGYFTIPGTSTKAHLSLFLRQLCHQCPCIGPARLAQSTSPEKCFYTVNMQVSNPNLPTFLSQCSLQCFGVQKIRHVNG